MKGIVPAYLLAHHAKSQLWHASTLLFGFFLTEACGIGVRSMGWIMATSLLLNGLVDLELGRRLRDRVTHEAAARRLQARGTTLTCGFFLLFCATPLVTIGARPVWALATLLGFRATYPLLDVPQNALVALLPLSDHARCTLLARRNVASGIAAIAVSVIAAPMLIRGASVVGWMIWAGGLSAFVCGSAWWLAHVPDGVRPSEHTGPVRPGPDLPFTPVLCALAVMIAASALFRLIEPYYAAFAGDGAGLLLWASIGGAVSQPVWAYGRRRWSEPAVLVAASVLLLASAVVLTSGMRSSPIGVALTGSAFGIGSGGLWLMLWTAMMARAAQGGATSYVGTFTCVSKASQAAAILLAGHTLSAAPYRTALRDPFSGPSLAMAGALVAIAGVCLALALTFIVSRTPSGETPATRRRAGRQVPDRASRPQGPSAVRDAHGELASGSPANR
ncbi:MFS transporter [Sphingomonas sp. PP-CC-3G-468]|uniref:MFS transporter n=1 Tax=Sphingomonas sp. PP-CC-3G-468 TaxID=2135656 RepID=UPI0010CE1DCD|nr:MFS transporter [Sphingomonas sp. PP-CC-3G-468]TCM04708.1 Na+/melibiose symporter-like transporter [Sphingomonas sp. PP-CC-3G-468]